MNPENRRYNDEDLVDGLKKQDPAIIRFLYDNVGPMIFKLIVIQSGGSKEDAQDILQEGLLAAYINVRTGKYQPGKTALFTTYLVQICKYKWLDHSKSAYSTRTARMSDIELAESAPEPEDDVLESRIRHLSGLISQLGEQCRKILHLFYWEKQSIQKIASQLNMEPSSAKNQKYRCMKKLKELASLK